MRLRNNPLHSEQMLEPTEMDGLNKTHIQNHNHQIHHHSKKNINRVGWDWMELGVGAEAIIQVKLKRSDMVC